MLSLTGTVKIYLATGATDMRRGFSGLYAFIKHEMQGDPLSGAIYGFCNKRRDMLKLFYFHEGGCWVSAKRLEQGTFRWPDAHERTVEYTAAELHLLVSGIDLTWTRQRRAWWERPTPQTGLAMRSMTPSASPGMHTRLTHTPNTHA
jgi:transposase